MTQRLFQDAGGTTPAIIAGQPVGLIKRLAGSVDATQATALSKPTYARHPWTGRRNLFNGAQSPNSWAAPALNGGITWALVGSGVEGGARYVDIQCTGTITSESGSTYFNTTRNSSMAGAAAGETFTSSLTVRKLAGELPAGSGKGFSFEIATLNSASVLVQGRAAAVYTALGADTDLSYTASFDGVGIDRAYTQYMLRGTQGDVIDVTLRFKKLQFERGSVKTALQENFGQNDIVEAGVADLWHLYNDGGDSLNVTLPAGTYGLASIDINRAITVTTITSDGTTPINTLRHERQLDVILRAGAFSAGEETAIRDYWGRVFA